MCQDVPGLCQDEIEIVNWPVPGLICPGTKNICQNFLDISGFPGLVLGLFVVPGFSSPSCSVKGASLSVCM